MQRFYTIAGLSFCISAPEDLFFQDEGALAEFRTEPTEVFREITLCPADRVDPPEGTLYASAGGICVYRHGDTLVSYYGCHGDMWEKAYLRLTRGKNTSHGQICRSSNMTRLTPRNVLEAMELDHFLLCHSGFLLHASFIDRDGEGILFTAPPETGKSTQAALWCSLRGAQLINGDRSAVVVKDNAVFACGVPYSGMSGVRKNRTLPLRAIVCLSQAKETSIRRLGGLESFRSLWEGCSVNTWDAEDMNLCARAVTDMLCRVPVYHLACTPDESAVRALEDVLRK